MRPVWRTVVTSTATTAATRKTLLPLHPLNCCPRAFTSASTPSACLCCRYRCSSPPLELHTDRRRWRNRSGHCGAADGRGLLAASAVVTPSRHASSRSTAATTAPEPKSSTTAATTTTTGKQKPSPRGSSPAGAASHSSSASGRKGGGKGSSSSGSSGSNSKDTEEMPPSVEPLSAEELARVVAARLGEGVSGVRYVLGAVRQQQATVPFLARYRQDATGDMDEGRLQAVLDAAAEAEEVHRRRGFMLASLEARGLLTPALRARLLALTHTSQLEDAWAPYKEHKTSLASRGRAAGLGPAAAHLLRERTPAPGLRALLAATAQGEKLLAAIVEEEVLRAEGLRERVLAAAAREGRLRVALVASARKKSAKSLDEESFARLQRHFAHYDKKEFRVATVTAHVVLALQRGEAKGALRVEFPSWRGPEAIFDECVRRCFPGAAARLAAGGPGGPFPGDEQRLLRAALESAREHLWRLVTASVRRDLRRSAERAAVAVFANNLRDMLLQPPLTGARVLAMDPGLHHGVKCVALDEAGALLACFKCSLAERARLADAVAAAVTAHRLNKIVIGNGTASQETAAAVAAVIKARGWADVEFAVVSEAGASVYSVSDAAKAEFPELDVLFRGAVSIGRRVLDPLSELVKIPPRSLGVGMYQHDVGERELTAALDRVLQSCVARVGVNAAAAHRYVIDKVPGLPPALAEQVVLQRHARRLGSREDLRRVPGMTPAVFQQVAGFLRFPNSPEPLDATNIHPEAYPIVQRLRAAAAAGTLPAPLQARLAARAAKDGAEASGPGQDSVDMAAVGAAVGALPPDALAAVAGAVGCGPETLRLVAAELEHPAADPRASLPHAGLLLRREIRDAASLRPGDRLEGVVQSITTFGAFVDCGMHDSVLVRVPHGADWRIGTRLTDIVFRSLDQAGRPRVEWEGGGKGSDDKSRSAGGGNPIHQRLLLESTDMLPLPALAAANKAATTAGAMGGGGDKRGVKSGGQPQVAATTSSLNTSPTFASATQRRQRPREETEGREGKEEVEASTTTASGASGGSGDSAIHHSNQPAKRARHESSTSSAAATATSVPDEEVQRILAEFSGKSTSDNNRTNNNNKRSSSSSDNKGGNAAAPAATRQTTGKTAGPAAAASAAAAAVAVPDDEDVARVLAEFAGARATDTAPTATPGKSSGKATTTTSTTTVKRNAAPKRAPKETPKKRKVAAAAPAAKVAKGVGRPPAPKKSGKSGKSGEKGEAEKKTVTVSKTSADGATKATEIEVGSDLEVLDDGSFLL